MRNKPHWHPQSVVRNPDAGTPKNPFGPVVRRYETVYATVYRTRVEARRNVSLSSCVIVRCELPHCAPDSEARREASC